MSSSKTKFAGLAVLAAVTIVTAACSGKSKYGTETPPTPVNFAPTLSAIADQTSNQDTVVGPIEFGVADRESDAALLRVTTASDGTAVVPEDGVTLGGSGATRTITVTPLEAATGMVTITVTVTDPQGSVAVRAFKVAVNARSASFRAVALSTFAKAEADDVTALNGFTFAQDADDPAIFEPLIPSGEE